MEILIPVPRYQDWHPGYCQLGCGRETIVTRAVRRTTVARWRKRTEIYETTRCPDCGPFTMCSTWESTWRF